MIRVLIVEDNLDYVKNILNSVINKFGNLRIEYIATTVREAVEIIKNNYIDLIFLDLKLPDSLGTNVIQEVKSLNNLKQPNIVIISAEIDLINIVKSSYPKLDIINKLSSKETIYKELQRIVYDMDYEKYQYLDIASKGLFHMANQVSGVLVCLLPILIYFYFKKPNILHTITLMFTILAMIMLGTRVASIGWIAICAVMILFYLFFVFIKREIALKKSALIIMIAIMIIFTAIIPFSPVMNRTYINDNSDVVEDNIKGANLNKDLTKFKKYIAKKEKENLTDKEKKELKKEKVNFIKNSYNTFGVDRTFIEKIYSYTEDPDFWLQEYEIPFNDRANHRQLKKDITRHVIELNDNPVDYIFGMSFTRLRNAQCYMENDILVHIYSIGIIGIILFIFPYFAILCYSLYKIFTNYKSQFNFLNISLLGSITLVFFAGIMSGNVFDEWICTLFLGLICGFLLININMNKSNNEENKKIKLKN